MNSSDVLYFLPQIRLEPTVLSPKAFQVINLDLTLHPRLILSLGLGN